MFREGAECLINNATAFEKIDPGLVNSGEFIYFFEDGSEFISNDIDLINAREPDRLRQYFARIIVTMVDNSRKLASDFIYLFVKDGKFVIKQRWPIAINKPHK